MTPAQTEALRMEIARIVDGAMRRALAMAPFDKDAWTFTANKSAEAVAHLFQIPHALACEIMWMNDDAIWLVTPRSRWEQMRKWIVANLNGDQPS